MLKQFNFADHIEQNYPSPLVYRKRQDQLDLIGCPYAPRTLSNLDSQGRGCPEKVKVGTEVAYPAAAFGAWLDQVCGNTSEDAA